MQSHKSCRCAKFLCPSWFFNVEWVHLKTWLFNGPTYDKIGLWSLCFSKNDWVHFFWLYSMVVWPTTKTASALPDFSIFDWVHFKTWFFDGPTYDKFGLWSLWFSKNDGVHFFGHILWKSDLRQKWPLPFLIFQHLIEYIFDSLKVRPIFYDSLTYDKNGLCPSWFFNFWLSTF